MPKAYDYKLCRLCLVTRSRLWDVFVENSPYESFVSEAMQDLLGWNVVSEEVCQPWMICRSCLCRLHEFQRFKARCTRSRLLFDSVVGRGAAGAANTPSASGKDERVQSFECGSGIQSERTSTMDCVQSGDCTGGVFNRPGGTEMPSAGETSLVSTLEEVLDDGEGSTMEYCWCLECGEEFLSYQELKGHSVWCGRVGRWTNWGPVSGDVHSGEVTEAGGEDSPLEGTNRPLFDPNVCCGRCHKVFRTTERLIRHINKHDFKCDRKKSRGLSNATAARGDECVETVKPSSLGNRTCEQLGSSLKGNKRKKKSNYICRACGEVFTTRKCFKCHANEHNFDSKGVVLVNTRKQENELCLESKENPTQVSIVQDVDNVVEGKIAPITSNEKHIDNCHLNCSDCSFSKRGNEFINQERLEGRMKKHSKKNCEEDIELWTVNVSNADEPGNDSFGNCIQSNSERTDCMFLRNKLHKRTLLDLCCEKCGFTFENAKLLAIHVKECNSVEILKMSETNIRSDDKESPNRFESSPEEPNVHHEVSSADMLNEGNFEAGLDTLEGIPSRMSSVSASGNTDVDERVTYVCDHCNKSHVSKPELRNHIVKCHLSLNPQKCTVCHRLFTDHDELRKHVELHPKDKKFFCTVCEESFGFRGRLKRHMKQRHGVNRSYICSICFNTFLSMSDVGLHRTLVHTDEEKPFKCMVCRKSYMDKKVYVDHLKICQLKMVEFQCNVCGKQMTRRTNLETHSLLHQNIRKYPCSMCPKLFSQCGARNLHVKAFHLRIRPHECEICNKRFATKGDVRSHYRSHSDERPFPCPECPKSFKRKRPLKDHLWKRHSVTPGTVQSQL